MANPVEKVGWCEWLCSCGKAKPKTLRRYSSARVEVIAQVTVIANKSLDLQTVKHGRLGSTDLVSLEQALEWNGRYTISLPKPPQLNPTQLTIKELQCAT